jgi:CHAT domain-containing protein
MRQLLTLSIFFFLCREYTYAQVAYTLADTSVAQRLMTEGVNFEYKKQFDSAYLKVDSAYVIFEKVFGEQSKEVAKSLYLKGKNLQNQRKSDEALILIQKALAIRSKLLPFLDEDMPLMYFAMGIIYLNKGENDFAIQNLEKAIEYGLKVWNLNNLNIARFYYNLGIVYNEIGDYDLGIACFKKTLDIRTNILGAFHTDLAKVNNAIGISYDYKGEFAKGISFYQKSLNIYTQIQGTIESTDAAICLNNIGASYNDMGEYAQSLEYSEKALNIRKKLEPNSPFLGTSYNNIGNTYRITGNLTKAIEYNEIALKIREKTLNLKHPDLALSYQSLAHCYEEMKQYDKALDFYQKSLDIHQRNDLKVKNLVNIAKIYDKLGNYKVCDSLYDVSLSLLKFKNISNLKNIESLVGLTNVLSAKGNYERARFEATKDMSHLNTALQHFQDAFTVLDYQSNSFSTEGGKIELKKEQSRIIEGAINTQLLLSRLNKQVDLLKDAFDKNEYIKSGLLKAQINETNALKYANISDDLLQKETQLRLNITWREKQKQQKINAGKSETDSSVLAISSKLFDLKQDYETLKQNLEKNYPEYYRLKYDTKTISVNDLQKTMLSPQQTLLSYFVGDSSIFAFVVRPDTFAVFTIKKDFPLEIYVKQLRDGLYGYQTAAVKTEKLYEAKADSFAQAAFLLHEKLIRPLSILLTKDVILVPDGVLGYVPFDVLLSEKPKDATQFKSHHYFSKDHIISYNYSATLWHSMQNKKHKTEPTKNFVGFAPYYNGDTSVLSQIFANDWAMRKGLDSLKYSGEEVFKAQKLMGGEAVLAKKATKKTFEETANNYRIIHLATHGKANDKTGDYCFLAFTEQKDSIDNELLYVRDIYNLSLNADLVVLSACETGIGELKRGEGIVSLARAFAYAGAKSMVTSLWSVNDKSTMQIMENFYRNLRKGQTKNYALWKAKQDYWEKAKGDLSHPFYWSSFIPIGDMKAVKE